MNFAMAGPGKWHLSELRAAIRCLLQCPTASVPGSVVSTFKGLHLPNLLVDFQATVKILYYQIPKDLPSVVFYHSSESVTPGNYSALPQCAITPLLTPTPSLRLGPSSSSCEEFSLTFPSTSNRLTTTVFTCHGMT